jgi:hypothetical protein
MQVIATSCVPSANSSATSAQIRGRASTRPTSDPRGSDRPGGRGGHPVAPGYFKRSRWPTIARRNAAGVASRRGDEGRGLRRPAVRGQHPRHHPVLLQPWQACYWLKVYEVPQGNRNSRGQAHREPVAAGEGEKITAVLPVKEFDEDHFVFMATPRARSRRRRSPISRVRAPAASSRSICATTSARVPPCCPKRFWNRPRRRCSTGTVPACR